MGLDKIVASILADSKVKEQSILSEAAAETKTLMAEVSRRNVEVLKAYRKKTEESVARLKERQEAGMEIEVKKQMLSARKQILDESFDRVLKHFGALPESDKRKLYSAMSVKLLAEFKSGTIHCRKGDEHLFAGLSGFTIGQPMDIIGGFLAENSDGTLVFDMRFKVLLKDIWDRHLNEISDMLFSEEGTV
jgi:V/A-type H+-transporting ATPase subunit E